MFKKILRLQGKMNMKFHVYALMMCLVVKPSRSQSDQKCRQLDKVKFPVCVKDGFHSTSLYLADNSYYAKTYSKIIKNITAKLGSCSNYTGYILCSLYVPRCKENMPGPWLPCREVCEEFVRGCSNQMNSNGLNWLKPLCSLLPTGETDSNCFKPPDFNPPTKPSPSLVCNKTVSNKKCQQANCEKTFVSQTTQAQLQNNLIASMDKLNSSVQKETCKAILRKLSCASYTPPCEGKTFGALCNWWCRDLFDHCPGAFNFTEVSSYCAEPAQGNTISGFCELTRWPSARHWGKGEAPQTLPSSFPAGLIAALVLVPLCAVCFIYVAVILRRRYEQKKSGYTQQRSTYTEPQTENTTNNLPM